MYSEQCLPQLTSSINISIHYCFADANTDRSNDALRAKPHSWSMSGPNGDSDPRVLPPVTDSTTLGVDSCLPCALPHLLGYLFIPNILKWGLLAPEKSQNPSERKGIWNSSLAHKPVASDSLWNQTGLQSASRVSVVSVLNCCLFISRLSSSAVMVGEGKCEPTREKGLYRQSHSQQSM